MRQNNIAGSLSHSQSTVSSIGARAAVKCVEVVYRDYSMEFDESRLDFALLQ